MAKKKREDHENESIIITNGQRRYVKRGERDEMVNFPGGKPTVKQSENNGSNGKQPEKPGGRSANKNDKPKTPGNDKTKTGLDEDGKQLIQNILDHELYKSKTQGVERTDGIIAEVTELGLLPESAMEKLKGEELSIETVDDVEKIIEDNKE